MTSQIPSVHHLEPIHARPLLDTRPGKVSLPRILTSFVGRETEARALADLLTQPDVRLVTITGTGGIGKTRLALHVGELVASSYPDGVWFIPLAPLDSPDQLYSAIAQQIGVRESGHRTLEEVIFGVLRSWRALLILDNFEHIIDASPRVTDLLTACPDLTILVTSRSLLRVTGERDFTVPVLDLFRDATTHAEGPAEAIQLFASRAKAVRPDFDLQSNLAIVQEICEELDGLPLAIELAAARVRYLSPSLLLSRLIGDKRAHFQLLAGGPRDAPARHRSLHDTIAWSYGLLEPEEQILFRSLSVFSGGFTLETAEAVCGGDQGLDVFNGIASLVDKSLLVQRELPSGEPWFFMLVTVREYAAQLLSDQGEAADLRSRHAAHYLATAIQAGQGLEGPEQRAWLDRLNAEHANLLLALSWFDQQGDAASLRRMVWSLFFFWWYEGYIAEARSWYDRALAHPIDPADPINAWISFAASILASNVHAFDQAEALARQAMELARTSGNDSAEAMAMTVISYSKLSFDDLTEAARVAGEAEAMLRAKTEGFWLGTGLGEAGVYLALAGELDRGIALVEEALAHDLERGDPYLAGVHKSDLGIFHHISGDEGNAAAHYSESVRLLVQAGNVWYLASPLGGIAALAAARDATSAARLIGYAQVLRERGGVVGGSFEQNRDARAVELAQGILGETRFEEEVAAGQAASLDEIVAIAESIVANLDSIAAAQQADSIADLSAREMEVLRLLVAGQSDRQIGEALFISHRTASKHVANILAKLGVSSRAEAAIFALRNGLV